jgi:hypothetical protein
MARSRVVPTAVGTILTDAADAAVAATVPFENGTFPVTSKSGTDPRCKGSAVDAARAGSPPLASSGRVLGTRSGPTLLGVTRAVSAEGLTIILAICRNPSTTRTAAVAPIKTCSLAMPSAATRTAACVAADASWAVATFPFPACAARRAAAIRSDLPPGSGITDNLALPILESDASAASPSPSEISDCAASRATWWVRELTLITCHGTSDVIPASYSPACSGEPDGPSMGRSSLAGSGRLPLKALGQCLSFG